MQYYPTGAIVAAPTTSLPESIGGERNWDYRYVWVRDATFTLYALYVLGYTEEAVKFFQFIQSIVKKESKKDFDLQLMYNIEGKPAPEEVSLNYLAGYRDSSPVRVGNGAAKQFQLDVYGSLIDAYYFVSQRGVKIDQENKKVILNLLEKIRQRWSEKDNGIWEVRSGLQDYTYSKVMSWVGADRAYRLSSKLKMSKSEKDYCRNLSNQIETWVWENCYSSREKKLYQYPGSLLQDSTNLLFILLQFLDRHENITKEVILNTAKELQEKEIFVYRYLGKDGLFGKEGAFVLCTFWLISALAMVGEVEKAEKLFDKFSFIFNEQSLLAEETDPETGDFLGNYPQAFSHIGLIMSLYYLHKYKSKLN
jgi:GH15 family glucan-1,4-alpha-glucosidase